MKYRNAARPSVQACRLLKLLNGQLARALAIAEIGGQQTTRTRSRYCTWVILEPMWDVLNDTEDLENEASQDKEDTLRDEMRKYLKEKK